MHTTTLGIDVAKNVFQLHGVDARGRAVLSRRVKRQQLLDAVANLPAGPCWARSPLFGSTLWLYRICAPALRAGLPHSFAQPVQNAGRHSLVSWEPSSVPSAKLFPSSS